MNFEDPNQLDISTEVYSLQTIFCNTMVTYHILHVYLYSHKSVKY